MIYAHGGLVPEDAGVDGMLDQIETWDDNNVYPLFFVWETGFFSSLMTTLSKSGTRGTWGDLKDGVVEGFARNLGGNRAWRGMKHSARAANTGQGGALAANRALRELAAEAGDDLSINLVGHSAGSIFHAHFIEDLAYEAKKTKLAVDNLILLAPAIRTDTFRQLVRPRMNDGLVKRATIFTMNDALERMDPTVPTYSKSLLYLIRRALEVEDEADLLGLEISLREDAKLASAFGLNGAKSDNAVVFSGDPQSGTSSSQKKGRGSTSRTHGGFDNNAPTMNSVLRIVLGKTDGEPIVPFRQSRGSRSPQDYTLEDFLPEDLRNRMSDAGVDLPHTGPTPQEHPSPLAAPTVAPTRPSRGRRAALCIGINNYKGLSKLSGCVADATNWAKALRGLEYKVAWVEQEEATGAGMLERIGNFLQGACPGDDFVLQFAGHGVGFDDVTGDELDARDEAMCGIDFNRADPGFVLDDELRAIYEALPAGVEVTSLIDCCHSGTMNRMAISSQDVGKQQHQGLKARHADRIEPIALAAHQMRAGRTSRSAGPIRGIHFGACTDKQLANESRKQGHFTMAALDALKEGGQPTNAEFLERVALRIRPYPLQTPTLEAAVALRSAPFALLL